MRSRDAYGEMAAANPCNREQAASLPLSSAEDELLDEILIEPQLSRPRETRLARLQGRRPRRLALGVAAIASCLVAFLLVFGSEGGRPTAQPSSAYASEVVRFADTSPRLLLAAPGWRVDGLVGGVESYMRFVRGGGVEPKDVDLSWIPTSFSSFASRVGKIADELETQPLTTAPVLGTTATIIQYHEFSPDDLGLFALWEEGGYVVELEARVPSMDAFQALLASLRKVDTETWLAAMPPSVVQPDEFEPTVRRMLDGIPLPPGFTADDVTAASVPTDRYQLGASVAGSVSCTWFARWAEARRSGNEGEVHAAVTAMATAKDWPVIHQMSGEGAYDQILDHLATAMPRGSVYKDRPLESDVESALSCADKGIPIPGGRDLFIPTP